MDGEILVDLSDPAELDRLRTAMSVEALHGFRCMCLGDVRFEFLDADAWQLTAVVLHHGATLRWDGWESDAVLADGRLLLLWLNSHGESGPLRQFEEHERRHGRMQTQETHWRAAMPTTLDDLSVQILSLSQTGESASLDLLTELKVQLELAFPDLITRTLTLLAWCGAGSGRCSGYPLHEEVPGLLLKEIPITEIVASLQDPRADARHYAGALRHLVGWKSRPRQRKDIDVLPEPMKVRLLQQARASGDQDKQSRAERWLTPTRAR
ncbi:hypothetical protein FNV58_07295 [Streptomyces sp. RLB1-9]|uniref:hypothetical protein n=1 Tax=Streptomyces sp. RLB1-9 TaxID=2594454 RepID=UPI001162925E|nr:hypothetical protein [Streptomyces sp. RLB1-9]QDN95904.1 hypothetical protein FNV58_07295 [Streptomyces sp. RLB1-9]